MIYVAKDGSSVKIGFTNRNVKQRLRELQTGSSGKLVLIGTFRGEQEDERKIHEQLEASHLHGEWFKITSQVLTFLRSKNIDVDKYCSSDVKCKLCDFSCRIIGGEDQKGWGKFKNHWENFHPNELHEIRKWIAETIRSKYGNFVYDNMKLLGKLSRAEDEIVKNYQAEVNESPDAPPDPEDAMSHIDPSVQIA